MNAIFFSLCTFLYLSDIYGFSIAGINGGPAINFSDFAGKKILLVNTATGSSFVGQYARLEELYQQNKDSLVIIAIPSNNFGHESNNEATIQSFVNDTYHIHYLLAGKMSVAGETQSSLYSWLTHHSESGGMSSSVDNDFQKYLIGQDGHLIGYFTGAMDPLDSTLVNAIHGQ
jgi:glutathione peroxidase